MDRSKLTVLSNNRPNPELIKSIEDFLELARKGEVIGYAGVATFANKDVMLHKGGMLDLYQLVGALEALKSELLFSMHDYDKE